MSTSPHVTVVTAPETLIACVAKFWPRAKLTPEQARVQLRRLGHCGAGWDAIEAALERHYDDQPDETHPKWIAVEKLVRRQRSPGSTVRRDESDIIRGWWRAWGKRTPRWAAEMLAWDEADPGGVTEADFTNWSVCDQEMQGYYFYTKPPWNLKRDLKTLHFHCRNLRTFGKACEQQKEEWVRELERRARDWQVKLDKLVYAEDEAPWE